MLLASFDFIVSFDAGISSPADRHNAIEKPLPAVGCHGLGTALPEIINVDVLFAKEEN
jgi:hypothetical protein